MTAGKHRMAPRLGKGRRESLQREWGRLGNAGGASAHASHERLKRWKKHAYMEKTPLVHKWLETAPVFNRSWPRVGVGVCQLGCHSPEGWLSQKTPVFVALNGEREACATTQAIYQRLPFADRLLALCVHFTCVARWI